MLSERMVALAAAVSVDYDYFSQHSHGSGWFAPMMFPPVPYPSGGGAEGGAEGDGGAQEGSGEAVPGDAGRTKYKQALCVGCYSIACAQGHLLNQLQPCNAQGQLLLQAILLPSLSRNLIKVC